MDGNLNFDDIYFKINSIIKVTSFYNPITFISL